MINHLIGLVITIQISSLINLNFGLLEGFPPSKIAQINPTSRTINLLNSQKVITSKLCNKNFKLQCTDLLTMSNRRPVDDINLPMKIKFRQSGGYAGLIRGCEINSELLTSKEAKKLKDLVNKSSFFETQSKKTPNTADLLNYQIIIETTNRKHQVSFDQTSLPNEFIPLVKFLQDSSDDIN